MQTDRTQKEREKIRERAQDSSSLGVSHQTKNRKMADEFGYVEPFLWTGIGRARSGCGAAIVGSTDHPSPRGVKGVSLGTRPYSCGREQVSIFGKTTNEMAKGTKINVFATTPHLTESAKTAISNPNTIQSDGTKINHIKLFLIANLNCIYPKAFWSQRNDHIKSGFS